MNNENTRWNRSTVSAPVKQQPLNTIVIPLNHPNAFAAVIAAFTHDNVVFTANVESGNFVIVVK